MITLFDIVIITIIIVSSILGLHSGLIKLCINFLSFVLSIIVVYFLYPYAVEIIAEHVNNEAVVTIFSGIISLIISLIICTFLSSKFLLLISAIRGGIVDKVLGLIAGCARGILICVIIFFIKIVFFSGSYLKGQNLNEVIKYTNNDKYPKWLKKSLTLPYLESINKGIIIIIPEDFLESIKWSPKQDTIDEAPKLEKTYTNKILHEDTELDKDLKRQLDGVLGKEVKYSE